MDRGKSFRLGDVSIQKIYDYNKEGILIPDYVDKDTSYYCGSKEIIISYVIVRTEVVLCIGVRINST